MVVQFIVIVTLHQLITSSYFTTFIVYCMVARMSCEQADRMPYGHPRAAWVGMRSARMFSPANRGASDPFDLQSAPDRTKLRTSARSRCQRTAVAGSLRFIRRRMLELADPSADFIRFWDNDDLCLPWHLEDCLKHMSERDPFILLMTLLALSQPGGMCAVLGQPQFSEG